MINPLNPTPQRAGPLRPLGGAQPIGAEATAAHGARSSGESKRVHAEGGVEESQLGQVLRASDSSPASRPDAVAAGKELLASGFFHTSEGIAAIASSLLQGD
tara:strand:- start:212 stop:517 length:306 start_codon:yes stop_codon:yes gene_type:complete